MEDPIVPYSVYNDTSPSCLDTRKRKIPCRRELLIVSLQRFYSSRTDLDKLIPILQGDGDISLRLIDWFVTNYAKRHSIGYLLGGQEFMVYMSYKSQLKAYSKKLFDPFCRRERIMFSLPGTEQFVTTVGKLNFFRWAIEKNVIEYLKTHREAVELEMNGHMKQLSRSRSTRNTTDTSDDAPKRVRVTVNAQPAQALCRRDVEINIEFD